MPRVLDQHDFNQKRQGMSQYDQYLDGQVWYLEQAELGGRLQNAAALIKRRAKQLGQGKPLIDPANDAQQVVKWKDADGIIVQGGQAPSTDDEGTEPAEPAAAESRRRARAG